MKEKLKIFLFNKKGIFISFWILATAALFIFRQIINLKYGVLNLSGFSYITDMAIFRDSLRIDLMSASYLFLLPSILIILPVNNKKLNIISFFLFGINFFIILFILIADFIYFPESYNHLGRIILTVKTQIPFLIRYSFKNYFIILLSITTALFIFLKYGIKAVKNYYTVYNKESGIKLFLYGILFLFLCFKGFKIFGEPLNIENLYDMYNKNNGTVVYALNGVYTSCRTVYNFAFKNSFFEEIPISEEKAEEIYKSNYNDDGEFINTNNKYPLMRQLKPTNAKTNIKYNLIIILLESWTPEFIDSLSDKDYRVTPNFDRIVKNGIVFKNAYAAGTRSLYGLYNTLLGMPFFNSIPAITFDGDLNANFSSIAEVFNKKGYKTLFAQTSGYYSYLIGDIANKILGFNETYGEESLPHALEYNDESPFMGYDYDLTDFLAKKAEKFTKEKQPFFFYGYTGTTHPSFELPYDKYRKYSDKKPFGPYLNTLYYADASIGHLMNSARKNGYLDNTVFIFLSDHTLGISQSNKDIRGKFRIPFVIYAPKLLGKRTINYTVSQTDLIPTIYKIFDIKEPFTALGKDALNAKNKHFAVSIDSRRTILFKDKSLTILYNSKIISKKNTNDPEEAENDKSLILSAKKLTIDSLSKDQWFRRVK